MVPHLQKTRCKKRKKNNMMATGEQKRLAVWKEIFPSTTWLPPKNHHTKTSIRQWDKQNSPLKKKNSSTAGIRTCHVYISCAREALETTAPWKQRPPGAQKPGVLSAKMFFFFVFVWLTPRCTHDVY